MQAESELSQLQEQLAAAQAELATSQQQLLEVSTHLAAEQQARAALQEQLEHLGVKVSTWARLSMSGYHSLFNEAGTRLFG